MKAGEWFALGPGVRGRIGVDGGVIVHREVSREIVGGLQRDVHTVALGRRELQALVLAWASVDNRVLAGGER